MYCFCTFGLNYEMTKNNHHNNSKHEYNGVSGSLMGGGIELSLEDGDEIQKPSIQRRPSQIVRTTTTRKINKARWVIFVLYLIALIYLIPQMFEKRISYIEIQHKTYVFTTITELGKKRWFRQIFHLWFYLVAIYILPFLLILVFNLMLLRTYLISKKRCQRYKLRTDPNKILRDYNSNAGTNIIDGNETRMSISTCKSTNRINGSFSAVFTDTTNATSSCSASKQISNDLTSVTTATPMSTRFQNFRRRSSARIASMKLDSKGRALTLTLFGVVAIFFICHFPAAIAKIIYVLYPRIEFDKSRFASICLDISNFLIMVNSSINFLLYIVFGPGKFRQEFSLLCYRMCGRFGRRFMSNKNSKRRRAKNSVSFHNGTNYETSSSYRGGGGLVGNSSSAFSGSLHKKCSITISENNFVMNGNGRFANNSIIESNEQNENAPSDELDV